MPEGMDITYRWVHIYGLLGEVEPHKPCKLYCSKMEYLGVSIIQKTYVVTLCMNQCCDLRQDANVTMLEIYS